MFRMRYYICYIVAWCLSGRCLLTLGDQICHTADGSPTCPENSCCNQDVCDSTGSENFCCDPSERPNDFCSACEKCVDCVWGPWDKKDYTYPNSTKIQTECHSFTCGDGLSPKRVEGKMTRRLSTEPGPGGNCDGSSLENCPWDCPEHCQLNDWTDWTFSNEVEGVKCGEGVKKRTFKAEVKHGGKSCQEVYSCTSNCYEEKKTVPCPVLLRVSDFMFGKADSSSKSNAKEVFIDSSERRVQVQPKYLHCY